jgi:hypothetical protein
MALSQAQRDAIYAALDLDALDEYASNPDSIISQMTPEEIKEGLKCGTLKLEHLNFMLLYGLLATQKLQEEMTAYTDARSNLCNAISPRAGNLIQADPVGDGTCKLYYGIEPPDALANQYVDPINGNDANAGTRAAPLRTIVRAFDRLPIGSRAAIHLHESGTHYWRTSERRGFDKTIQFYTYGPQTDVAQATWDSTASGWGWYGWANSPKARVELVYDAPFPSEPGRVGGIVMVVQSGYIVGFSGIHLVIPSPPNLATVVYWQGGMSAQGGSISFNDCAFETQANPIFTSAPDTNPFISVQSVDIIGAGTLINLSGGGVMNIQVYSRNPGTTNPQGLVYNAGTVSTYWTGKTVGRMTAVEVSPNLPCNF